MTKCSFKNCKNHNSKTLKKDGISYYHFPRNPLRREAWRSIVARERGEKAYKPNKHSIVCSKHFRESDEYVTGKGIKRLIKTAVPRLLEEIEHADPGCPQAADEQKLFTPIIIKKEKEFEEEYDEDDSTQTSRYNLQQSNEQNLHETYLFQPITVKREVLFEVEIEPDEKEASYSSTSSLSRKFVVPETPKDIAMRKKLDIYKKMVKDRDARIRNLQLQTDRLKKEKLKLLRLVSVLKRKET